MSRDSGGWGSRGRPPNDIWEEMAEPRLWVNITGSDSTGSDMSTDTKPEDQEFNKLTPGTKYKLITAVTKPQTINYIKNGSVNLQVTLQEANKMLTLKKLGTYQILVEKHAYKNRVRGEIKSSIVALSPTSELEEGLSSQGVIQVRKLEKPKRDGADNIVRDQANKIIYVPSGKAILTFEKESLPTEIKLFGENHIVEQHEPDPFQCKSCFDYGHLKKHCKSAVPICGWCSQKEHTKPGERCNNQPKCRHDQQNHPNFSKDCPTYIKEKEINLISELRKISYRDARRVLEGRTSSKTNYKKAVTSSESVPAAADQASLQQLLNTTSAAWESRFKQLEDLISGSIRQLINIATTTLAKAAGNNIQPSDISAPIQSLITSLPSGNTNSTSDPFKHLGAPLFTENILPGFLQKENQYTELTAQYRHQQNAPAKQQDRPPDNKKIKTSSDSDPG